MQGNEYHDIKGHFTDKTNDGGACYHEFGTLKSKSAKEKYIASKGFEKIRGNGYYHKEIPYVDKWGKKHDIYARYVDGDLFYNLYSLDKKESGYSGYSQSNSAIASKEQGSMPMSHWTKEEILGYLEDNDQLKPYIDVFKKMSLKKLKDTTLHYDGWHHTGKFYNQTDFYSINSPREIIQSMINDKKNYIFDNGLKKELGI